MKKLILAFGCIAACLLACRKEDMGLDYPTVKRIVVQGRMTNLEGRALFRGNVTCQIGNTNRSLLTHITNPEGRFAIPIDSVKLFLDKKGINLRCGFSMHTSCDTNIIRCTEDPLERMPFSIFQQSRIGDTLYLNYDLKMTPVSSVNFSFVNGTIDSLRFQYSQSHCSRGTYYPDYTTKFFNSWSLSVSPMPTNFTISGIKNGKVVRVHRLTETFKPEEIKRITLDMSH